MGRVAYTSIGAVVALLLLPSARVGAQTPPATAARAGEHVFSSGGVSLWYREAGGSSSASPPVVFLHGGPGYNSYSFAALEGSRLEPALRMVYFDQRGSGRSERPANHDYEMTTLIDDVEALRRQLGVPRIAIIGHSFGNVLALEYAARYPAQVSRLVLVSVPADVPATCNVRLANLIALHPDLRIRPGLRDSATGLVRNACAEEFRLLPGAAHEVFSNAIMFPDSILRIRQDSVDASSGLRNTGELGSAMMKGGLLTYRFTGAARLTMPVLVIAGGKDGSVGVAPQQALAQSIPSARLLEYPRAGHFVYLDEPERFARDVIAFLRAP